ncbi:phage tail protein [Spirillospora sp. NPDC047418]|jgi:phage tail-like protein
MTTTKDPASSLFFRLTVSGVSFGAFNGCDGLAAQVDVEQFEEGGNNGFVWQLPTRVRHSNVRLTRPVTADTAKVATWISSVATGIERADVQIDVLRADGSLIASWGLREAIPVNWTGPTLDPEQATVATEVLEIAHHGFTASGGA